ncbi:hypothetical protein DP120_03580 [Planococcus halotolerans]|uniref:Uncharacterized protein n=1 Tax=Planococcus halotolerans TaxID=2233542 RepID=A0A365L7L8_9BACL|nr:hypothetical protein DP120_03580 [Planococcus halotolerans]
MRFTSDNSGWLVFDFKIVKDLSGREKKQRQEVNSHLDKNENEEYGQKHKITEKNYLVRVLCQSKSEKQNRWDD